MSQDLLDLLGKSDPEGHGESKSELDLSFWVYSPSILESEVDTYPKDPGVWFVSEGRCEQVVTNAGPTLLLPAKGGMEAGIVWR